MVCDGRRGEDRLDLAQPRPLDGPVHEVALLVDRVGVRDESLAEPRDEGDACAAGRLALLGLSCDARS